MQDSSALKLRQQSRGWKRRKVTNLEKGLNLLCGTSKNGINCRSSYLKRRRKMTLIIWTKKFTI